MRCCETTLRWRCEAGWRVGRFRFCRVSHDVGECYLLGADVMRMADGQVIEQGPVEVVLAEERRRLMERLRAGSTA